MENVKANLPKIVIGTTVSLVALFALYKLFGADKGTQPAGGKTHRTSQDPFCEIIDPRWPKEVKVKEARDFVTQYIQKNIAGKNLKVTADGKFHADDFKVLLRIMNFYA